MKRRARDSLLGSRSQLAQDNGYNVVERAVSIDEVVNGIESGQLKEIFSTGTAAVISPIGEQFYKDKIHTVNNGKAGELSTFFFNELQAMQWGERDDIHKWVVRVG